MGVVGAEIVAEFVCNDKQVPSKVGRNHWEVRLIVHGTAECTRIGLAANHTEISNPAGTCIISLRHEVNHVPVGIGEDCI